MRKPTADDPRRQRAFILVSRQVLVDSDYATVICAAVYTRDSGLSTQVAVGVEEGLKHDSAVHCDGLVSLPKALLTNRVGTVDPEQQKAIDLALRVALAVED